MVPPPEKETDETHAQDDWEALEKAQDVIKRMKFEHAALIFRLELAGMNAEHHKYELAMVKKDAEHRLEIMRLRKDLELSTLRSEMQLEALKGKSELAQQKAELAQQKAELAQRQALTEVELLKLKLHHERNLASVRAEVVQSKATMEGVISLYSVVAGSVFCRNILEDLQKEIMIELCFTSDARKNIFEFAMNSRRYANLQCLMENTIAEYLNIDSNSPKQVAEVLTGLYQCLSAAIHGASGFSSEIIIPLTQLPLNPLQKAIMCTLLRYKGYRHDQQIVMDNDVVRRNWIENGLVKISSIIGPGELRLAEAAFKEQPASGRRTFRNFSAIERDLVGSSSLPHIISDILGMHPCPFCIELKTQEGRQQRLKMEEEFECNLSQMPIEGPVYISFLPLDALRKGDLIYLRASRLLGVNDNKMSLPAHQAKCKGYFKVATDTCDRISIGLTYSDMAVLDARLLTLLKPSKEESTQKVVLIHWLGPSTRVMERSWVCTPVLTPTNKKSIDQNPKNQDSSLFPFILEKPVIVQAVEDDER